jgi:hypothetical protein
MGFGFLSKGKMELKIEKFNFSHGETINGTVTMQLKKPILAKGVFVKIFSETTTTRRTGNGIQTNTSRTFEFAQLLDGEKEYSTQPFNYDFQIKVPAQENARAPDGALGTALKAAKFISGVGNASTKWFLEAYLDIPKGFDLNKKVQINVG